MNLKIAFIVVALGAAVTIALMFFLRDESIPETGVDKTQWLCGACDHKYKMTPQEEHDSAEECRLAEGGPLPWPPAFCPECREKQVYRARACSQCGWIYFGPGIPGSTGKCPQCFPEARPPEPEEEEEPEAGQERQRVRAI